MFLPSLVDPPLTLVCPPARRTAEQAGVQDLHLIRCVFALDIHGIGLRHRGAALRVVAGVVLRFVALLPSDRRRTWGRRRRKRRQMSLL